MSTREPRSLAAAHTSNLRAVRRCLPLLLLLAGCHPNPRPPKPPPEGVFSPSLLIDLGLETKASAADPVYVLSANGPDQGGALLWSAAAGVSIGPWGTSAGEDGSTLPAFMAGDYLGEDLKPCPAPLDLTITVAGQPVRPLAEGYRQTLDLRYGLLTTHWYADTTQGLLEARISSLVCGAGILTRAEFHARAKLSLTVERVSPAGSDQAAYSGFRNVRTRLLSGLVPDGAANRPYDASNVSALTQSVSSPDGYATWLDEADGQPRSGTLTEKVRWPALPMRGLLEAAKKLTRGANLTIEGPEDDQRAVHSFIGYLRSGQRDAVRDRWPNLGPARFSPFGLSNSRYNGHVFWDADVWLMPALAFIEPSILQDLADYRLSHLQPNSPAPFAWESSVSGKETSPTDSKKEIHVSGSVLWGLMFEKALGAKVPASVVARVAAFYRGRATRRPDGTFGILDVMSPDESHIGPNDLYTNLVAQWAINGATWRPSSKPTETMFLPRDGTSFLTYEGDPVRAYKQAAAVLSVYPLQYPPAEEEARTLLERFQGKVIKNGPAMTDSIHATIWARLGEADKAYDVWKRSWGDFVKGPMLLFSEKRSTPTTYFATGAAGCLQSVIYGFLGFRVDEQPLPHPAWKQKLENGRWLSIDPHLPSAWKSVTFSNFRVLGRRYTLTVKREGPKTVTSVSQGV